jgi:hypothetical protein
LIIDLMTGACVLVVNSPKYGAFRVLIDKDDWEIVSALHWRAQKRKDRRNIYFQANVPRKLWRNGMPNSGKVSLHRFVKNAPSETEVDHIHHDYMDCRKDSLAVGSTKVNAENASKHRDGCSSPFKGVFLCKTTNTWKAQIHHSTFPNGRRVKKTLRLGTLPPTAAGEEAAARAYDAAALELFTRPYLNFPTEQAS